MSSDVSSGWYVYAVVCAGATLPEAPVPLGLDDAPLTLVSGRTLAAAVSLAADATPAVTSAHLLQHERAVEAVCRVALALPVRFGTVFPDRQALARALQERRAALHADLARIGGKVEMGLSVLWREPGPSDPPFASRQDDQPRHADALPPALGAATGPGARYLAARFSRYASQNHAGAAARRLAERIGAALHPHVHVIESQCDVNPTPRLALRATYLLEPDRVQDFKAACGELRTSLPDLRFLVTGPWPPYSFVSRSAGPAHERAPDKGLPIGTPDGDHRAFSAQRI
jgi:gas vesicle protein GvpL/GvpF